MFYFIFIILVLSLFIITRNDRRISDKYLIAQLLSYAAAIVALILYISKDVYYYNVLNRYFSLPKAVWNAAIYANFPESLSIRALNVTTLLFLYFGMCYAICFLPEEKAAEGKRARRALLVYCLLQAALYEPFLEVQGYRLFYRLTGSTDLYDGLVTGLSYATRLLNAGILAGAVVFVFYMTRKTAASNFFRGYAVGDCICFAAIVIAYEFVFWFAPANLVSPSILADYVVYRSIPLVDVHPLVYTIYPVYLVAAGGAILFSIISYQRVQRKLSDNALEINRVISASDTTSKAFCHYMKNEVLAIESEIRMLDVENTAEGDREELIERCENLYRRLDEIHHATKMTELKLRRTDPKAFMDTVLDHMALSLKDTKVVRQYGNDIPFVMLDEGSFEQAVHNILVNALDAMEKVEDRQNTLTIGLSVLDHWVQLSITDNGTGMSEANRKQIFNPFFSSHPIREHWGIGLTLTYKIVDVHGGRIEVSSREGQGTTFRILLPSVRMDEAAERQTRMPEPEG